MVKAVPFEVESEALLNLDIIIKKKLVLYQPLLRKLINLGAQLATRGVVGLSCLLLK